MKITIFIDHVNGDSSTQLKAQDARTALFFLSKNDHEGSGVCAHVELETAEEVYEFLKWGTPTK